MIKKEIAEIKKLFKASKSTINRMVGCYVGGEKQMIAKLSNNFLSLPEEESFKYFEILSKTLSGTLGKNLLNMEFPTDSEMEGGSQEFLLKLRDSALKDEELLSEFYNKVIESYDYTGNYLILLIYANYDVPGMAKDGTTLEDSSEEVYEFIMCSICPVELDAAALSYEPHDGCFLLRERDWVVEKPAHGFLFPAFNDRSSDVHSLLYFSKNGEKINDSFIEGVLGANKTLTAGAQKESFQALLEDGLEEECSYDLIRTVQEKVNEIIVANKEEPAPVIFEKQEVLDILSESGASQEKVDNFEKKYDETIGKDATLQASNIVDASRLRVKTSTVEIKYSPENAGLLETRIVDGRRCIVIPLDTGVEVNGIRVIPGAIETGD